MSLPEFRDAQSVPSRRGPLTPRSSKRVRRGSIIWSVVQEERRALIRDVEELPSPQWETPSLCSGWTVHDVLAHLVDTAKTTRLNFIRGMIASRFDFDRSTAWGVTRERTGDPRATLAEFRAVHMRRTGPPVPLATRLVEAFIHGEDIRRPLKIARTYPAAHVATALDYQLKTPVTIGGGKESAAGWRLVSTDEELAHGAGPEVRGPAIALLLAVSGRQVNPEELSGPGAAAFLPPLRSNLAADPGSIGSGLGKGPVAAGRSGLGGFNNFCELCEQEFSLPPFRNLQRTQGDQQSHEKAP